MNPRHKTVRRASIVLAIACAFVWSGPVMAHGRGELRDASGRRLGTVERDGTVRDASGRRQGRIEDDGTVRDASGRRQGRVEADGTVRDASGRRLGSISGGDRRAALQFFF